MCLEICIKNMAIKLLDTHKREDESTPIIEICKNYALCSLQVHSKLIC